MTSHCDSELQGGSESYNFVQRQLLEPPHDLCLFVRRCGYCLKLPTKNPIKDRIDMLKMVFKLKYVVNLLCCYLLHDIFISK